MKKVVVTGATGFIGNYVVKELCAHGTEVIAVVRKDRIDTENLSGDKIRIVHCNLDEIRQLETLIPDRDIDVVYHFGWQGVSDEDAQDANVQLSNIKATLDLIEMLPQIGCHTFIGAGSIHELEAHYGMEENKIVTNLRYMYKTAKVAAHWMGKTLAGSLNIRFFWPIISNAYGVGEKSGRLINTIIRSVFSGRSPDLTAGNQYYDFIYVSDVAKAFYLIGEKGIPGTNYYIGSGKPKPLREYLETVGRIANTVNGSAIELGFGRIKSDIVYLPKEVFDVETLCRDTGFTIEIPFETGIQKTAKWIKDSGE